MRWRVASNTKISGRADQGCAKMKHPDTVDEHARGERVGGACDGLGQFQSSAAIGEDLRLATTQDLQKSARSEVPRTRGIAALEDVSFVRFRQVGEHHGASRRGVG